MDDDVDENVAKSLQAMKERKRKNMRRPKMWYAAMQVNKVYNYNEQNTELLLLNQKKKQRRTNT